MTSPARSSAEIIPVLDLMRGRVVRGIAGRRESYRPVAGRLVDSADPLEIADAFVSQLGLDRIYLADLDAIEDNQPAWNTIEQLARAGHRLMVDAGLIVLVSFISPFRSERRMARELFESGEFLEVFVDASIEGCELRDTKGLYAKARRGKLKNFTGIDSPYEPPESAELILDTAGLSPEQCTLRLLNLLGLDHYT